MIIILKPKATSEASEEIMGLIESKGLKPLYLPGVERIVLGAIGDERVLKTLNLESHPQVDEVKEVLSPYKLVSREIKPDNTCVSVGSVFVGEPNFTVMAGPCAVESYEQLLSTAQTVKSYGATILRGGAFKPRTSPYSFQGLELEGLKIIQSVSLEVGIPTVTEVIDVCDVDTVAQYADVLQIGARNMQNFRLLQAVGKCQKPVLLKRGMSAKIEDLLLAAEYIVAMGNPNVILCERGIRTFETCTRNTLDLSAVPYLKEKSHLPVIVDPSHATGIRAFVPPMSLAALACGADGILVDVHPNPKEALCDGAQSLYFDQFGTLMEKVRAMTSLLGKTIAGGQ